MRYCSKRKVRRFTLTCNPRYFWENEYISDGEKWHSSSSFKDIRGTHKLIRELDHLCKILPAGSYIEINEKCPGKTRRCWYWYYEVDTRRFIYPIGASRVK